MNADLLSMVAGSAISLVFSYIPGVSDWYAGLDGTRKRLVMLGALLLVAISIFLFSCAGIYEHVACDQTGAVQIIEAFFSAAIANQATFLLSPKE